MTFTFEPVCEIINFYFSGIKEMQKFRELHPGIPHDCYIIKAKVFNERKTQKKRLV